MEYFRVHFIGSGYESVKYVKVLARNPREAYIKAEELYKINGWKFKYNDMYSELAPRG